MNPHRSFSPPSSYWVHRCLEYGRAKVQHYANRHSPRSLSVSGDRGAEKNPLMQAQGKLGEVAFAELCGLDPETAVDWELRDGDAGEDVRMPGGTLVDVKTNFDQPSMYPSKDINHLLPRKRIYAFVSVSIDDRADLSQCWVEGWVAKEEFLARHKVSAGRLDLGEPRQPGTWYMFKDELRPIRELIEIDQSAATAPQVQTAANASAAIDAIIDAYINQPMSREERTAWAWVNAGSTMQKAPVGEAAKPRESGWVRVWRYDYAEAEAS
jgi:hypothetical protein